MPVGGSWCLACRFCGFCSAAVFDVRECRLAAALALIGLTSYAISAASFLGFVPIADPEARALTVGTTLLAGHWFVLAAAVSYARFVVLDAQGLIAVRRPQPVKKVKKVQKSVAKTDLPTANDNGQVDAERAVSRRVFAGDFARRRKRLPIRAAGSMAAGRSVIDTTATRTMTIPRAAKS